MSATPTVLIADDHPPVRLGVRMALTRAGMQVVCEAADSRGAVAAARRRQPDICLLDIYMPGDGIEAAATIAHETSVAVVMLTVSTRDEDVFRALRAGAVGYLLKDTHPDALARALCGVLRGEAALPRTLMRRVVTEFRQLTESSRHHIRVGAAELTAREWEILNFLREDLTTTQIADRLTVSPITIRRHISSAVSKLGVGDRAAAVALVEGA
jgi:DNA-binding NarL/FixJ family response regulator